MEDLFDLPQGIDAESEFHAFLKANKRSTWGERFFGFLLLSIYRREFALLFLLSIPFVFATLANPMLLKGLLLTLQGDTTIWQQVPWRFMPLGDSSTVLTRSLVAAIALFLNTILMVFLLHHIFFRQLVTSLRLKLLLSAAIYDKALKISRQRLQSTGSGFIVNLIAVDVFKITNLWNLIHSLWVHPIILIGALIMLHSLVGNSAFVGLAAMCFSLLGSGLCTRLQSKLRKKLTPINDQRVGLTGEMLAHIRNVKIMSMEQRLAEKISELRNREVSLNRRILLLTSLSTLASSSAPVLAMGAMFLPIIWQGGSIAPSQIFPALALLMGLRFALQLMPEIFLLLIETRISLRRIRSFLNEEETSRALFDNSEKPGTIRIMDAQFSWEPGTSAISVPQLSVTSGELITVIGEVGAGKSALILALLNELPLQRGEAHVSGKVALVSQQPWLVSATIRQNIVCDHIFDEQRYQRALSLSELEFDLATFPGADLAEIGERGITLSGGQRQRLALARAYYHDADIILLDDPLSALDPQVADRIFERLITKAWSSKTRVLVTHRLEYALKAGRVLLVENGRVAAEGNAESLADVSLNARALFSAHESSHGEKGTGAPHQQPNVIDSNEEQELSPLVQKAISLEERASGAVQRDIIKNYLRLFAPRILAVGIVLLFVLRQGFTASLDLWWAFFSSSQTQTAQDFIVGFIALSLLVCLFNFLRAFIMLKRGMDAGQKAHRELLEGIMRAPLQFFESNPLGRILNRFSRDLETIDSGLPRSLLDLLICGFDVATTVTIVLWLQPWGITVIGPVLNCYFYLQKLFRPTSRELRRLDSITRSPIFALLSESLRGVETVRAFNLTSAFCKQYARVLDLNGRAFYSLVASNRWLGLRLESLGTLVTLTAALSACFLEQTARGAALAGFALTYAMAITGSMNWLVRMFAQTESDLTSFERIEYYANQPSERWEGTTPPPRWPEHGAITFSKASVRYRPDLPLVLKGISASIGAGERIGIVGRTGSGKTTLTQTIFRLLELESGSIEIDGQDISKLSLSALREALTMIPQEPALFSGSIREHLDPDQLMNDADLLDVLARVELSEFIRELPNGLETIIVESAKNISAGQRQLLCLASAIIKKSKIIILDEATAQVDPKCDLAIQKTIRTEFSHATQLVIAHRLGTVMDCDRIFVFSAGEIAKTGTPAEVFERIAPSELSIS